MTVFPAFEMIYAVHSNALRFLENEPPSSFAK
jgi:hypothetical protein